jgi:serine/threonine protein kinase
VVIKLLSFGNDFEWDDLKLFEREAETLKALTHPAIPRYLDFFELDLPNSKGFALVQTYVEGSSLDQHLKAGRTFSEGEVRQIAKALLEILIYLHERKPPVIHRDIKPSNILLTNRSGNSVGEVYLVDFGSVQTLAAKEGITYTVVGTYGYIPLEQFGGRTVPASDLYSLGATLIYLVTGTHPADLPQQDGQIQFKQASNLTPGFSNWLRWMTQPSLDKRLTSARQALQALEQKRQRDIDPPSVRRLAGSKVLLTKNADFIEILIPPKGFSSEIVALILFAIPWNSFVFFWTAGVFSTSFLGSLIFVLFLLPFWGSGICMLWSILFALFGQLRLSLNHQQISLTYELFGLKFGSRSAPRQDIHKLALIYSAEGKPQTITIWAGIQEYQLGCLCAPELDWLADELSGWLKLPIQVKRLPPAGV